MVIQSKVASAACSDPTGLFRLCRTAALFLLLEDVAQSRQLDASACLCA